MKLQRKWFDVSSARVVLSVVAALWIGVPVSGHCALQTITSGTNFDLTYDDALTGLFGTPNVSGSTIFFTPASFKAESLNGAGVASTTSTINVTLTAKNSFSFGSLALVERGDYRLNGTGSSVSVGGQLIAFDQADPINTYSVDFITPSPGTPLNTNNNTLQPWQASAFLNVAQAPFFDPAVLRVTIQNQLTATTTLAGGIGSQAFIQKKFAGSPITLEVLAVPLPAAAWLFLAGLSPLIGVFRRR